MVDREAWHAAIHGVTKSWTRPSDWTELRITKLKSQATYTRCQNSFLESKSSIFQILEFFTKGFKQTNKQKTTKRPNPVTYLNFPNRLGRKTPLYDKYFRYRSLVEKNSSNHKNVQILLISMNFKVWMQPEVLKNSVFGAHQIHYLVFINLHICFTFSRW